jgi:hypothetical protein
MSRKSLERELFVSKDRKLIVYPRLRATREEGEPQKYTEEADTHPEKSLVKTPEMTRGTNQMEAKL